MSQLEDIKAELEAVKADRDRKAEACRTLGEVVSQYGRWIVEATDSQDAIGEDGDGDWEAIWDRVFDMRRDRGRQKAALEAVGDACNNLEASRQYDHDEDEWERGYNQGLVDAVARVRQTITDALS